ncbi:hypothetical protein GCM10009536_44440 [Streptomyces thermocarboxydus]
MGVALHGGLVAVAAGRAVRVGSCGPLPFQRPDDGGVARGALQGRQPCRGRRAGRARDSGRGAGGTSGGVLLLLSTHAPIIGRPAPPAPGRSGPIRLPERESGLHQPPANPPVVVSS